MAWMFTRIPTAFLPDEDQGILFAQIQTPSGATAERTKAVIDEATKYLLEEEKDAVTSVFAVNGFNFGGRGQNASILFIKLRDWDERGAASLKARAVAARANAHFRKTVRDAMLFVVPPPSVMELGNVTGFDFMLMDRAGVGHEAAGRAQPAAGRRGQEPGAAGRAPERHRGRAAVPARHRPREGARAGRGGVRHQQHAGHRLGFVLRQRFHRPRSREEGVRAGRRIRAHAARGPGEMVRAQQERRHGSVLGLLVCQLDLRPAEAEPLQRLAVLQHQGQAAPGYSSGAAMQEMERLAAQLPTGVGYEWTGMSFEERLSGAQAPALYAISLIVVFLCLAALYESWSIPSAVMLVVPLGIIGALAATLLRGLSNDVYFQVGLLTTVGLAAKNAILIVEFAKEHYESGAGLIESAIHAARQRLRPILMTSLAFILGVVPLAISSGAGSGSQNAIGTGVIGGMLTATFLAIFFVPTFFVVMLKLFKVKRMSEQRDKHETDVAAEGPAQ